MAEPATSHNGADPDELRDRLVARLLRDGCVSVGVCGVEPLTEARRIIEERHSAGLHGGMQFVYRNPERSTNPRSAFPSAKSAIVVALPYAQDLEEAPQGPHARVARYASSELYDELRRMLSDAATDLVDAGYRGVVVADDNALVDRAIALRAGLGWLGKNTNLLVPNHGSWVVIGSILTDAVLEPVSGSEPGGTCGSCERCRPACPTGALVAPGVMDASLCLSWLLQTTGPFPREHRRALGVRIYGCDDCQEACPPSRGREVQRLGSPSAAAGVGAGSGAGTVPSGPGQWMSLRFLLGASDSELLDRCGSWYIPQRDPRYLRRNALVVLGNSVADEVADVEDLLHHWLRCGDELLVSYAAWAARASGREHLLAAREVHDLPAVRAELAQPHPDAQALAIGPVRRETGRDVS
ncbi:MAG: tRNA epoxyqueuosine(34) reductase QueG [Microthrixaceae bacterium]